MKINLGTHLNCLIAVIDEYVHNPWFWQRYETIIQQKIDACSLEQPPKGGPNECPQSMFWTEINKNTWVLN